MSFFSSQKVSVREKEKRIAESHIVQPYVLPSSSGPSSRRLKEAWDKQGSDFWVIFSEHSRGAPSIWRRRIVKSQGEDSEIFKKVHVHGAGNNEKTIEQNKSKNNNKNKVKTYIHLLRWNKILADISDYTTFGLLMSYVHS